MRETDRKVLQGAALLAGAAGAGAAADAGAQRLLWRLVFSTRGKKEKSPYDLPTGEQYDPWAAKMRAMVKAADAVPFEEVWTTSEDGLPLFGRYYPGEPGAPVQLMFHGWKSNAVRDFAGGAAMARELGQGVLLVDERGINRSGGDFLSFGILESRDVLCWVRYVSERLGSQTPLFLSGISMGASAVLMAMGRGLPENVLGVIADSPFSSPRDIICKVARESYHLPPAVLWPMIRRSAEQIGYFDPEEIDAVRAVHGSEVPVLLIHGSADRFVPEAMSLRIAAAARGYCQREVFPGAAHGISYLYDKERYRRVTRQFMALCLERAAGT